MTNTLRITPPPWPRQRVISTRLVSISSVRNSIAKPFQPKYFCNACATTPSATPISTAAKSTHHGAPNGPCRPSCSFRLPISASAKTSSPSNTTTTAASAASWRICNYSTTTERSKSSRWTRRKASRQLLQIIGSKSITTATGSPLIHARARRTRHGPPAIPSIRASAKIAEPPSSTL